MSLNLALVISGNAAGAKAAAEETTTAVRQIGVTASQSAAVLAAANDEAVATSRRVTEALTGQDAALRARGTAAAASLNSVAGAARLTSSQLLNLSRQGNDVVTMFALGAPAMQIFASQAGQIYDVLESGPKGLRGSLTAIRASLAAAAASFVGFVGPLGLMALGVAGVGAAFVAYDAVTREKTKSTDDLLKAHKASIEALRDVWGQAADAKSRYGRESIGSAAFGVESSITDLTKRLREANAPTTFGKGAISEAILGAVEDNRDLVGMSVWEFRGTSLFKALQMDFEALQAATMKGEPDVLRVIRNLEGIGQASDNAGIKAIVTDAVAALQPFRDLATAIEDARRKLDALSKDVGTRGLPGFLLSQGTTNRQDAGNLALFESQQAVAGARSQAAFDAEIQALRARSPEERAAAARSQASSTYNDSESAADRRQRIELAGTRALVTAQHTLDEAQKERLRSLDQTLASQQLDISLIGKTAGETARLRMEFELTSQVRAEAARNNVAVDEAEIQRIREKAAEYGRVAEAAARANLGRDLQFERDQLGRSPIEATVADRLKSAGLEVDLNSEAAAAIRVNELLKQQKEIWEDIRDSGVDAIGSIVDSALGGFSDIDSVLKSVAEDVLKQFTELAVKNPLANTLYNKGLPTLDGIGGIGGFIKTLLGGGAPEAAGGQALATADITAGVVNVNGALGLGAGTGAAGGPLGAITRLLSGANDNSASGGNAFLDLIGKAEGTDKGRGYNETLGYGAFTGGDRNLVSMTLNEIGDLQRQMLANPANNFNSSALGRYQITGRTLNGLRDQLGLSGNELFDEKMQDRLAMQLASRRGADVGGLRNEWEGLRNVDGDKILEAYRNSGKAVAQLGATATGATQNLGTFGNGLGQFGTLLSKFPTAPAGGGGGILSWLGGLLGGGASLSPGAWAAIQAGGGGLYDIGGPTGGSDPRKVAGLVHEKEYVMDEPVVRVLGVPFLDNLRRAAKSGRGYAEGGYAMPGYSSSASAGGWSSQQSQPTRIERHYHNYAGVNVREEESDDGQGGRREDIIIEEKLAAAANRPGSSFNKTLSARGARQPVKRR
ncbi:MAG: hypothetical protein EOQ98_19500 [Mesorhizobium sp.]|uniref:phage tail length tape measure family protein n=1 Tax=Mesorhizobium sp. TaxID=1871066 RepID=UPI000FE57601|nr:phage tail length tape measure family protein [Mesorhizobium sp.]RWO97219.1 MAG: hypothetical protein EOQ98_19500 [Mesorhizobium sp.]TIM52564.1 MAG: hypothetical protein E5Y69_00650 [Mesorhizobium sp.]